MFFSPAATDIILTFNNANIAPYIYAGDNFTSTSRQRVFNGHYGFGYAWYHCRTPDICCALGAYYETAEGWAKKLTVEELQAADPHLYIKFPSKAANTLAAAGCRTIDLKKDISGVLLSYTLQTSTAIWTVPRPPMPMPITSVRTSLR